MDLCQRPLAKPLSVLKDKANVKALSFLRSELLFSELVEVLLSGDQVNDAEGQFFYFRIRRVIRRVQCKNNDCLREADRPSLSFAPDKQR